MNSPLRFIAVQLGAAEFLAQKLGQIREARAGAVHPQSSLA
jgi:hypothetical protein